MKMRNSKGILVGLVAGVPMAALTLIQPLTEGMEFGYVMKLIAATWLGVDALIGGFWTVLLGLATHFTFSAALGIVFCELISKRTSPLAVFWGGVAYGVSVWVVMTFGVLPWLNPTMFTRLNWMPGWWYGSHVLFGSSLFTSYFLRRSVPVTRPEVRLPQAA